MYMGGEEASELKSTPSPQRRYYTACFGFVSFYRSVVAHLAWYVSARYSLGARPERRQRKDAWVW